MRGLKRFESDELRSVISSKKINSFKLTIIYLVGFFAIFLLVGFWVKYPKKIVGSVSLSSKQSINKVFAPNDGELRLFVQEGDTVSSGDILATIVNSASLRDILRVKEMIDSIEIDSIKNISLLSDRAKIDYQLGEVEEEYYDFILSIDEYKDFKKINISGAQINNLINQKQRINEKLVFEEANRNILDRENQIIIKKFQEDSSLYEGDFIVKDEMMHSEIERINYLKKNVQYKLNLQDLRWEKEKIKEEINLIEKSYQTDLINILAKIKSTFLRLKAEIAKWEELYLVKSPTGGTIQYYHPFVTSSQQVRLNEPLLVILPPVSELEGVAAVSAHGYGNIAKNDTVTIKLKDYPFKDYGYLMGTVKYKSKFLNDSIYYLKLDLKDGLVTNKGNELEYIHNMGGEFEFLTQKTSIVQRIFNEVNDALIIP